MKKGAGVLSLKAFTAIFSIILLSIAIASLLITDYYTFTVGLFVALSGFLCQFNSQTAVLLHCFSLATLLAYGILVAIIDALHSFDKMEWKYQLNYLSKMIGLLLCYVTTVGLLFMAWSKIYLNYRKERKQINQYS